MLYFEASVDTINVVALFAGSKIYHTEVELQPDLRALAESRRLDEKNLASVGRREGQ